MLRSATFTIGLLLAGLAFVGFLMLGGMMAPPPYAVVVAVQDIPAYSTLDPNALGIDAQRINSQVANMLVQREEVDQYTGGFVIETIHAGEPVRKSAIVAPGNPQAINRLALVMTDPDKVAMVIPVDSKTAPSQIAPGDWLDLVVGLAPGNISAGSNTTFSNLLAPPTPVSPIVSYGPTPTGGVKPVPTVPLNPPLGSLSSVGSVGATDMNLPADKVVIQNVPVLAVRFQQVPNPAFTGSGGGFGETQPSEGTSQPAYIQGDIQTITVLVPRASVELLTFGKDNGRVHVVLLPAKTAEAANGAQSPTFGITFNDVLAWMMRERSQVAGGGQGLPVTVQPTQISPVQAQPTAIPGMAQATQPASAQPTRATANSPRPTATATPPTSIPTGLDIAALLVPLTCGVVLLVLFVAVVRFVRKRRRDNGLV
jgi:hypothetical protein